MSGKILAGLRAFARRREEFRAKSAKIEKAAAKIIKAVQKGGDKAVLKFTKQWDKANLRMLRVSAAEFDAALKRITDEDRRMLQSVAGRFRKFYESQKLRSVPFVDHTGFYSERVSPLDRVGLYVPGGRAPLVSTLLMLAVPAEVAGVRDRLVATPPDGDGSVPPLILAAAKEANVSAVFKMGGAQAIAAFACGTKSVPRVDKIFGPGNLFVTAAKKLVFGTVGIDMLAGPSELVVIADASAPADMLSEDLMAQAEHGPDSLSLLLTTSPAVSAAIEKKVKSGGWAKQVFIVVLKTLEECVAAAAEVAPEHLSLCVAEPEKLLPSVGPAGAIFLGTTAVAFGDYVAGPNHTLPTAGTARFSSPLSVESFFRRSSILNVRDPSGELARLGGALARMEGLDHHARSLQLRSSR